MVKRKQAAKRQNRKFFLDERFDSPEDFERAVLADATDLDHERFDGLRSTPEGRKLIAEERERRTAEG
jgi:hypothetical protein